LLDRTPERKSEVLGDKATRCVRVDGSAAPTGELRIAADDEPFTVRIESGRIASILTKPLKIVPGVVPPVPPATVSIASIRIEGLELVADVVVANATNCSATVSRADATARRAARDPHVSLVRFASGGDVVVAPGERATGRFSVPLDGDGTYEISASATTEIVPQLAVR
ncbi:MAG: hypothetical protein ACRDKG_06855, partial [Actinomycetota bacterium]